MKVPLFDTKGNVIGHAELTNSGTGEYICAATVYRSEDIDAFADLGDLSIGVDGVWVVSD